MTLNSLPAVGSMIQYAGIRRPSILLSGLTMSGRAASAKPVRLVLFVSLLVLWACFAAGCPAQVTCHVRWECPAGSTGVAGCEGLMHAMSGDFGQIQFASQDACQKNYAVNAQGLNVTCDCGNGSAPSSTASNGFQLKSTGSTGGDLVNDAAQLWILQNIKNPYTMTFAQNFTQSFLTSYIQGQRQREAIEASIRQQQEQQAELAREAEQRRIDAIFARLNSELKLSGIDSQLTFKTGGDPTQLAMKLNSSGSDALAFKLSDTPNSSAVAPSDLASETGGLKLKLSNEQPAGGATPSSEANSTASASPAPTMGIPGLPGIYLNDIPPAKSPEVAAAALSMDGPERDIAEDAALQAAQKNPELAAPSDDPFVQDFQQRAQEYAEAEKVRQAALDKAAEAQGHVQADQTALNYANGLAQTSGATEPQSQAMARLQAVVGEEENMSAAAQVGFDRAGAEATVKREEAAISLASLAPPAIPAQPGQVSLSPEAPETPLRDQIAASEVKQPSGSTPFFGSPAAKTAVQPPAPQPPNPSQASSVQTGNGLPVLSPNAKPEIFTHPDREGKPVIESLQACMARLTNKPVTAPPTLEELHKQLESTAKAMEQLEKSAQTIEGLNEDFAKVARDARLDIFNNQSDVALDTLVGFTKNNFELDKKVYEAALEKNMVRGQQLEWEVRATEGLAGPRSIVNGWSADYRKRAQELLEQREGIGSRLEMVEKVESRFEKFKNTRDIYLWITDSELLPCKLGDGKVDCSESGPAKMVKDDEADLYENMKTTVKFGLMVAEPLAEFTPGGEAAVLGFKLGTLMIDNVYDVVAIDLAKSRLQSFKQNDAQMERARAVLEGRIERLNAEASCYESAGPAAHAEAAR